MDANLVGGDGGGGHPWPWSATTPLEMAHRLRALDLEVLRRPRTVISEFKGLSIVVDPGGEVADVSLQNMPMAKADPGGSPTPFPLGTHVEWPSSSHSLELIDGGTCGGGGGGDVPWPWSAQLTIPVLSTLRGKKLRVHRGPVTEEIESGRLTILVDSKKRIVDLWVDPDQPTV